MSTHLDRRGLTLIELIVVLFMIGLLIALLLPLLSELRHGGYRYICIDRLRMIGMAIENYQSGKREYPVASWNNAAKFDALASNPAGMEGAHVAGYSWAVVILPQLEEKSLYDAIKAESSRFASAKGPFDLSIVNSKQSWQHASCVTLPDFICPDWDGGVYSDDSNSSIDSGQGGRTPAGHGAAEYENVDSDRPGTGERAFKGRVAPTSFKPMIGTHIRGGVPVENGGMRLTGPHGLMHGDFKDGTSKTILICETRESAYASWYDGTLNWLVGQDPNQAPPGANDKPPWTGAVLALNRGFDPSKPGSVPYLKKSLTSNAPQNDVWWGPSSDRAGGLVGHVFVDNHVIYISDQCDPETYLSLITRADGETIDDTNIR
jgi:prepilin-type N-terminal cleavage/methylation domain-containing protein